MSWSSQASHLDTSMFQYIMNLRLKQFWADLTFTINYNPDSNVMTTNRSECCAMPACWRKTKNTMDRYPTDLCLSLSLSLSLLFLLCSQFKTDQPVCQENTILTHNERERTNSKCSKPRKLYRELFFFPLKGGTKERSVCLSLSTLLTLHSHGQLFSRKTDR